MIKEIKYNGHSASPSDYQSPDGDMACMLNCIPERGALKPILPPKTVKSFDKNTTLLAIHKVANREHYILYAGTVLTWEMVGGDATDELYDFSDDGGVASVTPIGNTLAVLDGNGTIHYFLWKHEAYINLGTQLPELNVKPYISSRIYDIKSVRDRFGDDYDTQDFTINKYKISGDGMLSVNDIAKLVNDQQDVDLKGNVRNTLYEKIFAQLNLINRLLRKNNAFTSPFYVRFAYRLYDGSYVKHTVPTLMVPTTWGAPLINCHIITGGDNYGAYYAPLYTASHLMVEMDMPDISSWSDLIHSIDVFVTSPLISYSDSPETLTAVSPAPYYSRYNDYYIYSAGPQLMDNGKKWNSILSKYENRNIVGYTPVITGLVKDGTKVMYDGPCEYAQMFVSKYGASLDGVPFSLYIADQDYAEGLPLQDAFWAKLTRGVVYTFNGETDKATIYEYNDRNKDQWIVDQKYYIKLSRVDGKDFKDILTDYSTFYKIAELKTNDYKGGFLGMVPINKTALENLTVLPTLSDANQQNSLNIVSAVFPYNNRLNIIVQGENLPSCASLLAQNPASGGVGTYSLERAYVKVVENAQTSYYRLPDEQSRALDLKIVYFAYPKATAVELEVFYSDSQGNSYVRPIPLTRHPFLNLAYAFNMFDEIEGELRETGLIERPQTPILYGNKIKTSNVNNPFIFSEESTSLLPVGKIHALSTAAKALSQGQFGQFPLYAFTDKGVWALEVTGTGTYSARQPITRDVVLNPESVTQIDDAVLFATQRGIMLLSGAQVQCISEVLDGTEFDITQLEFAYKKISEDSTALDTVSWDTYKANIQMLYDYTGQCIIVFNPGYTYSYVFSLDSKQWGIMESNIQSTVDYYPQAYAMTSDGALVNYSATDGAEAKGHYITRPLKLDAPDVHKTITGIIQRGQFKKGHVNTMLYGSRDLDKWYPIYGSNDHILRGMRGTPYKYFRIASTFHLERDESITGCSVDYEPRLNNKLR